MTEVYDPIAQKVVANGGPYVKVQNHYEVPNCLPLNGPQVDGTRYRLRDGSRPQISVECTQQGAAGIQTAHFKEV
jgi:hypothetical protein